MTIDLEKMSLKDMRDLRSKLDRAINSYEERRRREALVAVEEAAREYGFNLSDLTTGKPKRAGTVPPKYANPQDPTMTWTGRGRKPRWVVENLDNGKQLEDLLIG
ncbi:H-NS histone family protein [Paracoccus sp. PARArs4]|uniref:H-NS histone family protein n=2 Tax=Paracoccus TaxID=265 RepID=UPI0003B2F5DF|nr:MULTISPECIES: H-NS histone family protein [Paracoccus]